MQQDAAEQIQLSFFDAVTPTEMNINTIGQPPENTVDSTHSDESHLVVGTVATPEASIEAAPADDIPTIAEQVVVDTRESLGQRMRAAREARGMTREEAAARTKVRVSILDALESDQYERIGHGVYLRGYLHKYLALLDLPPLLADRLLENHSDLPPLTTSGTISRPRYLFQRYSGSALYLVLTGVIIVPAVLLAMRAGFDANSVRIAPLDTSESSSVAARSDTQQRKSESLTSADHMASTASQTTSSRSALADQSPLAASMTPFPPAQTVAESQPADDVAAPPGQHTLKITLAEPSWVEIVASDGQKLEYGLLAAGTTHTYHSAQTIDARLGNANGATVQVDGKPQDLTAFRHSNVAHFKLAGGEASLSHSGG